MSDPENDPIAEHEFWSAPWWSRALAAQVAELMTAGCAKVYREKASGAKTDRPELRKILAA